MKKTFLKLQISRRKTQRGSGIIELLIATMVVGVVVVAAAIVLTRSVKNTSETRYREVASIVAQDAIELFKREREIKGWNNFASLFPGSSVYCLNSLPQEIDSGVLSEYFGQCEDDSTFTLSKTTFQREVRVTRTDGGESLAIDVSVRWNIGGSDERSLSISQILKNRN